MRYSNDLRIRVAKRLQKPGLNSSKILKISKEFQVSVDTLKKWIKKLEDGTL
jgi:transposase